MSMTIDRIGPLDPIQNGQKTGKTGRLNQNEKADFIAFSAEAKEKGELYQAMELVSTASDIRIDRVEELRRKINDPAYINDTIINATAEKILENFGV
jgi:negative regulator of flagellin synthesis FlgM